MTTETELRELLQAHAGLEPSDAGRLDVASVIRRSRRRRLTRQAATAGVLTLALAGFGVGAVTGLHSLIPQASTMGSASIPDIAKNLSSPAGPPGRCGASPVPATPNPLGLVLTVDFSDSPADAKRIEGTVTLTNTGTQRITGSTAIQPVLTVSQAGVVLWHSNGFMNLPARFVDLSPGQSMVYPAFFTPVRCTAAEGSLSFSSTLPPLSPGRYQVSAAIALTADGGGGAHYLITGPPATIRLQ